MMNLFKKLMWMFLFFAANQFLVAADLGKIVGVVTDGATGDPLPGANIYLEGTTIGAASDLKGKYQIYGISPRIYTLCISYIGYKQKEIPIKVLPGETQTIDVKLDLDVVEGETVTITAQAEGQRAAINQQIMANSIKNIVSAQLIQEIPDASAAEAVGRLPGVSLKGSELVIRGLSPRYSKIQIDGIDMASTSFTERSSSLGMISQYMLEGIEMTKTAMSDNDADVVGAQVNLIIKEAPEKPTLNLLAENGYNTLSESFGNQNIVCGGSRRFLSNRLGVFGQLSFERSSSANNQQTATYVKATRGVDIENMSLRDTYNTMNGRLGATVLLDYKTPLTTLKMSNFFSRSSNESIVRDERIRISEGEIGHILELDKDKLTVMTNSLRFDRFFSGFEVDGGLNYSYSKNERPEGIVLGSRDMSAVNQQLIDRKATPIDIPQFSYFDPLQASLTSLTYNTRKSESHKLSVDLNMKTRFSLTDWLGMKLKIGGKFRHQKKNHDLEEFRVDFYAAHAHSRAARDALALEMDWIPDEYYNSTEGNMGFEHFMDPDYQNNDFLLGDYKLGQMASEERVHATHEWMFVNNGYYKRWEESFRYDYHGHENYAAAYVMPEIIIGRIFTFIPGVRYERNQTSYTGYRLPFVSQDEALRNPIDLYNRFIVLDITKTRDNEFVLPMVHAICRPFEWFAARTSYTHTLSRPSFGDIIPSWDIGDMVIDSWNNPYLKPELSKNSDLAFSFHSNKIGLFTIGGFHKSIENMIFLHGETSILKEDIEENKFDGLGDPKIGEKDVTGYRINYRMNNDKTAHVYGYEVEWQSNFSYLPGVLKSLVLKVNYTRFYSDAKYPKTNRILDYQTFKYTYIDTFYVNRLIDQANHILNVTIGFDYKDFSIRGSMKYTDDLFAENHEEPLLRRFTDERFDYDISIKQGLPFEGFEAYCNISNLGRSKYVELNAGSGYPTRERYGGIGFALGLRYRF